MRKADILTYKFAKKPEIEISTAGWHIKMDQEEITAQVMINSIVNPSKIKAVDTPLVNCLLNENVMPEVHDDFRVYKSGSGYLPSFFKP